MGQVLLIVVFAVMFLRDGAGEPWFMPDNERLICVVSTGSMAAIWGVLQVYLWAQGRRLDRRGDLRAVARCDTALVASRVLAVSVHAVNVLGLGWLDVVRYAVGNLVIVDEFLAALPVLFVFVGGWWSMYPIECRLRDAIVLRQLDEGRAVRPMPSRGAYVLGMVRHQAALILLPLLAIMAFRESLVVGARRWEFPMGAAFYGIQLAGVLVILLVIPAALRHVWDTVRLGPGPLRELLERICREQRVRIRELLVWRTHGTMLNGAVMGMISPVRYVLLTDALLEALETDQIEAVMAHELGHVRRRHMAWLGVAVLSVILLAAVGADLLLNRFVPGQREQDWAQGVAVLPVLALGLITFGIFSRRFEWQADAFAAQHLSGYRPGGPAVLITQEAAAAMCTALGTVARLNHIPRRRFAFRHGSIATRQERLQALVGQPADRLKPDRDARRLKIIAGVALIAAVLLSWRTGVS